VDGKQFRISDTSGLLSQGVVRIGDEAIEYENISGNTLVVREKYKGFEREKWARGARGTTAREHRSGALVTPYGYSDPLTSRVFKATELAYEFAQESLYTKLTSPLSDKDKEIKVKSTSKFQEKGFLLLAEVEKGKVKTKEIIKYSVLSGTRFRNCERAQLDTKEKSFPEDSYVFPISMMVKNNQDYDDSGMVQLDNEWISYDKKVDDIFLVFTLPDGEIVDCQKTNKFNPPYRGVKETMSMRHAYGVKVIPVFRTQLGWAGRFDEVTIINANDPRQKEEKIVNWSSGGYVAFSSDVSQEYKPGSGTRILKFPSGELPSTLQPFLWGSSILPGTWSPFWLDEVHLTQAGSRMNSSLQNSLDNQSTDMDVNISLSTDGGIIKLGDEYISYYEVSDKLVAKRGFSNTSVGVYSAGTPVFPIFFIPVSSLTRPITAHSPSIFLKDHSDFPSEGYIRCGNELMGYTQKGSGDLGQFLTMPVNRNGEGLLRGAFGTEIASHVSADIVYSFPTRYWDRTLWGYDGTEAAYLEAARTAPGAIWKKIRWQEENPSHDFLKIVVKARVDGKSSWEETPTNQKGGIFQFTNPQESNILEAKGDMLEIRVYFSYQKGAYQQGLWKAKALLKSLFVDYQQPVRIWESEE
jgi:hypothetical protein